MKNIYIIIALVGIIIAGVIAINAPSGGGDTATLSGHQITVHKTPTCGCCGEYVKYLKNLGAEVTVVEHDNLTAERAKHGIPSHLESCHFSEIEGYVVEGHVPAEAMVKLIAERPDITGIALPGMPAGSPGMGGTKLHDFTIHQLKDGGDDGTFMTI